MARTYKTWLRGNRRGIAIPPRVVAANDTAYLAWRRVYGGTEGDYYIFQNLLRAGLRHGMEFTYNRQSGASGLFVLTTGAPAVIRIGENPEDGAGVIERATLEDNGFEVYDLTEAEAVRQASTVVDTALGGGLL